MFLNSANLHLDEAEGILLAGSAVAQWQNIVSECSQV